MNIPATVEQEPQSLLEVIARAARDPNVDIDKMERLLEMQERVHARHAREEYAQALAALQPLLPVISERGKILNKNQEVQSTYAYWEDVNEHIRPMLADHGFSLSFRTGRIKGDNGDLITVTGVLSHRSGHFEETTLPLPADMSGSKNAVQSVGSSLSYGKRYTAFLLLNITTKGEDDDGGSSTNRNAEGETLPRTKLEGKHSSPSKIKAAMREFAMKLNEAQTPAEIDALEAKYDEDLKQCERDLPVWWKGNGTPEGMGVAAQIRTRREVVGSTGLLDIILAGMRQQPTRAALVKWAEINESQMFDLSDEDRRKFDAEYDAYEAGLAQVATVRAG